MEVSVFDFTFIHHTETNNDIKNAHNKHFKNIILINTIVYIYRLFGIVCFF
jgi:hypothetical protein